MVEWFAEVRDTRGRGRGSLSSLWTVGRRGRPQSIVHVDDSSEGSADRYLDRMSASPHVVVTPHTERTMSREDVDAWIASRAGDCFWDLSPQLEDLLVGTDLWEYGAEALHRERPRCSEECEEGDCPVRDR
jgi:hypothetical protein